LTIGQLALRVKEFPAMTENNITATTIRLLNYLDLPITKQSIRQALADHESPASLLALSEALSKWKIRNAAYNISIEDFDQLPRPFLVRLTEYGGQFGFVTDVTADELILVKEYERNQRVKLADFEQRYAGMVLVLEPSDDAGEPAYFVKRMQELGQQARPPLLLAGLLVLLSSALALGGTGWWWLHLPIGLLLALKVSGVAVAGLLLNQSFGQSSARLEKWCRRSGTDCASVLASPGAKIAGGLLSWAELGFFYFAGTGLLLLLPHVGGAWLVLRALNAVCICFSAYSLYYQYKVVRHWCLLCCALLVLFYAELLVLSLWPAPEVMASGLGLASWPLLGALLAPIIGWGFLKPHFTASALVPQLTQRLQALERNKELFQALLRQQPAYPTPELALALALGPPQAEHVITIISNPTCGPCARAHQAIEYLLAARADVQVRLVFAVDAPQDEVAGQVAGTVLALYQSGRTEVAQQALHAWYHTSDYPSWQRRYPELPTPAAHLALARQQQWCAAHGIELTPTILINGHQLPAAYEPGMLKYLL
jgi:uncharacterized membrane protein